MSIELNPLAGQQEHPEEGSVRQEPRAPARHKIEDSSSSFEIDDTLSATNTNTEDKTFYELLIDSLEESPTEEEAGTVTTKTKNDEVELESESGRKLDLLPPDLAQTEGPTKPVIKGKKEIIAEIESILGKVREQYSQNDQSIPVFDSEGKNSEKKAAPSITDLLKISTSQTDDVPEEEDPVIEKARERYMNVWNQEANRLNAPYMRVTKAWPELGILYMPDVTQATDQIKESEAVKEAAAEFKKVWENRVTETDTTNATVEPLLKVLGNFMNAWLWAETVDQETAGGVFDNDSQEAESKTEGTIDRSTAQKRLPIQGNSFWGDNFMSDLDSQLNELYKLFNTRQPQPSQDPSGVVKSADLIRTVGSGKIMLSCSVVPGFEGSLADTNPAPADNPVNPNIPVNNPAADIRPIIDPLRVLSTIMRIPSSLTESVRQQTEVQDRLRNPIAVNMPFSNPTGAIRPIQEPNGVNRQVDRPRTNPVRYSEPFDLHEAERPPTHPKATAPVSRNNYKGSTADHRYHPGTSKDSFEPEEVFGRRYPYQQPWRQSSWLH